MCVVGCMYRHTHPALILHVCIHSSLHTEGVPGPSRHTLYDVDLVTDPVSLLVSLVTPPTFPGLGRGNLEAEAITGGFIADRSKDIAFCMSSLC